MILLSLVHSGALVFCYILLVMMSVTVHGAADDFESGPILLIALRKRN